MEYKQIKEIRSAPRAFGAWGDIVFFLKDGSRLELAGLERYDEVGQALWRGWVVGGRPNERA